MKRAAFAAPLMMALSACNGQIDWIGRPPPVTAPGAQRPEIEPPVPQRVSLAPAPAMPSRVEQTGSLWRSGPKSLFGDRRARQVGDIVTVLIEIEDEAEISNVTTRGRSGSDEVSISALYGIESTIANATGGGLNPAVGLEGSQNTSGDGRISRGEEITLRMAATVVNVMPNGHLVIQGSQEVRVNFELRDLQIAGIVRPEDISRKNVITYDKIADARILYGGRGQITDLQQPRIGQQVVDLLSPF